MPLSFLDLPAEIRNFIFGLVLIHKTPIVALGSHTLKPPRPVSLDLSPNVCLVSHAVYDESSSILYGENTFQAHPTFLTCSVFAIDPRKRIDSSRCISKIHKWHVRARLDCDPYHSPEVISWMFTGALELEMEVFRASWGTGTYDVLDAFAKVRNVRRAKVHGSVGDKYARWLEGVMMSEIGAEIDDRQDFSEEIGHSEE
ncbi:MAG: hypothetical protein Q9170_005939 [Blastenia crenularia]